MSAVQNCITASRIISQDMSMFAARPVSAHMVCPRLQQRDLSARRLLIRLPLKFIIERDSECGVQNNKLDRGMAQCGFLNKGGILISVHVSGGFEKTAHCLLAFDIGIGILKVV